MAGKTLEQLQADYDNALAAEQDNPGDESKRKAAGTASKKLMAALSGSRASRPDGFTVTADDQDEE